VECRWPSQSGHEYAARFDGGDVGKKPAQSTAFRSLGGGPDAGSAGSFVGLGVIHSITLAAMLPKARHEWT
jgi:hypothetical protein